MNQDGEADAVKIDPNSQSVGTGKPGGGVLRWLRWIGLASVPLLVAAIMIGPGLAARKLRGGIERKVNELVNGHVTIEGLKLSLNGKVRLSGIIVDDAAGQLVALIPEAKVDVGLRSLLTGKRDISAVVTDAEIELVRGADGRWNFDGLMVSSDQGADDEAQDGGEDMRLPELDIHGRFEIVNATVTVRSPDTVLTLCDVTFGAGLDGKKRGLTIESRARVFSDEGSVGDFALKAVVWPKAGDGATLSEFTVTALDLGVVQEALKLMGSPLEEGSALAGTLNAAASGSLEHLDPVGGFEMKAEGSIEPPSGRAGKFAANVRWDGAADVGLVLDVEVDGVNASAGLGPLLARVHPVFAGAQAMGASAVDGLVTSAVHVTYGAALPLERLKGGWAALPKEPLRGTGELRVDGGFIETSPFFREVLQVFGQPANPTFDLKPLGFAVEAGRIQYTNPWTWTIQGTETRFAGSVGLGGDLDLSWIVPVTGGLARQNRIFGAIEGETFEVALGGTLSKPTLNLVGALSSLARRAAKRELGQRVQQEKERLKTKLEEQALGKIGQVFAGSQGAADLLKSADDLWKAGKKAEAAALYGRIAKEFSLSPTYLFNKKRIKRRRKG